MVLASESFDDGVYIKLNLMSLRSTLISAVLGTSPTKGFMDNLRANANSASVAVYSAAASSSYSVAVDVADSSAAAAVAAFYSASAYSAYSVSALSPAASSAAFLDAEALQLARTEDVLSQSLWGSEGLPDFVQANWEAFIDRFGQAEEWSFWIRWYAGFLQNAPLPWELQRRVALGVSDEVWEQGVGAVAEEIRKIEAEYLAEQSSLAEDVFYNDETARIARRVVPQAQPKTMANMLAALRDDLEDASSGNLLSKTAYDYRTLDRMMTKYHRNPERVEMDVVKISGSLRRQIDAGDLPDAPEVEGLCTTLVEIGLEIRAQHPEIDEARLKRGAKAVQESSAAERKEILAGLDAIRATVEEDFAEEIIEDLEDVVEAKDGPPDEDATSRSGNRLAKIWLVLKKAVAGTGISAGAVVAINEALPVLQTLWQIMAKLLGIG
jgi:hypothetical protein